ncbi:MAG: hypothetical protein GVY07_13795 [Bacteroidetes bacterium]|jgi:hypothetical protein|nr:hypothetical protein [Bacteroidota bacterium]
MKTKLIISLLGLTSSFAFSMEENHGLPEGMKGGYEMKKGEILKVYSAEEGGATFRAYVVEWNGSEVVVSDPLGSTDKKAGEVISFMANRVEMNQQGRDIKMLQFMLFEFPSFDATAHHSNAEINSSMERVEELRGEQKELKIEQEALEKRLKKRRNKELSEVEEQQLTRDLEAHQAKLKKQQAEFKSTTERFNQSE